MVKENNNWKKQKDFSTEEIKDRLKGFTKMNNIYELKPGMQIRYVSTNKDMSRTLKMGGILTFVDKENKKFIKVKSMISSNINAFSVQLQKDTEIYFKSKDYVSSEVQESIRIAGSDAQLIDIIKTCGSNEDEITRNISYVKKKYGTLLNMIVSLRELKKSEDNNTSTKGGKKQSRKKTSNADSDVSSFA